MKKKNNNNNNNKKKTKQKKQQKCIKIERCLQFSFSWQEYQVQNLLSLINVLHTPQTSVLTLFSSMVTILT